MGESLPSDSIWDSIVQLQAYKAVVRKEYPSLEVGRALDNVALGVANGLLPSRTPLGDSLEYYLDKYIEKAYELCPDIHLIADAVSEDSSWAIRFYPESMNSYIFYKDNHGCKKFMKTDKIRFNRGSIRKVKSNRYICHTGRPKTIKPFILLPEKA